jgi:RNA-directed DNA polymerase
MIRKNAVFVPVCPPEKQGWADYAWGCLMRWIRAKYKGKHRLGMKELRRRFCGNGWRIAHNGAVFTGTSSVTVDRYRYRYRGSTIPTPWATRPAAAIGG